MRTMLQKFRDDIMEVDEQLILLLSERMRTARELGRYKKEKNIPVFDANVETAVIKRNCAIANKNSLSETFVQRLYGLILEESKTQQRQAAKQQQAAHSSRRPMKNKIVKRHKTVENT